MCQRSILYSLQFLLPTVCFVHLPNVNNPTFYVTQPIKQGVQDVNKISNVPSFLLAIFFHLEKQCPQPLNVSHQSSTCLILELGLHFKLFDFVEFCKIIFLAVGSKNNLWQNSTQSKSLKSSLHSNQAGAALVRHIKWWQHCFFRCLNLASQKEAR